MDTIYRQELMDIYRNPVHRGKMTAPTVTTSKRNKLCGDEVNLSLEIENGVITNAKFNGSACAVSVISSEILLDFIKGKEVTEVLGLDEKALLEMINLNLSTSRVGCATLILHTLKEALEGYAEDTKRK